MHALTANKVLFVQQKQITFVIDFHDQDNQYGKLSYKL